MNEIASKIEIAERMIYFTATSGGNAKCGQVWEYSPKLEKLRLVYESPDRLQLNFPDNLTVSPRGGILVCEDGYLQGPDMRLTGVTHTGELYPFAQNNVQLKSEVGNFKGDFPKEEFAGACFTPDGKYLFVNIQTPGITFAITGPWQKDLV
jgi:secreted PhoX family phosphatase